MAHYPLTNAKADLRAAASAAAAKFERITVRFWRNKYKSEGDNERLAYERALAVQEAFHAEVALLLKENGADPKESAE
ncbi:hypothetical protein ACLH0O_19150 [Aeromonas media]|jgi:hypothetical protein|uniref:hypothetical protein n=1 Tax=Aeromonas sp. QDB54 TaxID=2989826 RepID=UPI0022E1662F|nr:hypothetical protein [Aeromonas sp. QDB54]